MRVSPQPDSYSFVAYGTKGGKACEIIVSVNGTHITIDGVRKSWQNARAAFEADSSPRELEDAKARRMEA
jgi:hypothetical protein